MTRANQFSAGPFATQGPAGIRSARSSNAWLAAVRAWFSKLGLKAPGIVLFLAFPPVVVTLTHGQTSFLVGALLGGGSLMVREKPWLAGVLIGLATIKPQFGLLVVVRDMFPRLQNNYSANVKRGLLIRQAPYFLARNSMQFVAARTNYERKVTYWPA